MKGAAQTSDKVSPNAEFEIPLTQVESVSSQQESGNSSETFEETQPYHEDSNEEQLAPTQVDDEQLEPTQVDSEEEKGLSASYKVGDRVQVNYNSRMYLNGTIFKV